MSRVLLLRPTPELDGLANKAVDKFNKIFNSNCELFLPKNASQACDLLEGRGVDVVFIHQPMEIADLNTLLGSIKRTKKKPFFITSTEVFPQLVNDVNKDLILKSARDFTEDFIFECVRSMLVPENQKLDIRYIKSIIKSVVTVVKENTEVDLKPGNILEAKAEEAPEELSAVVCFYGDGFLGSLTINTSRKLLSEFTQKMIFCDASDVTEELMIDVFNELAGQTLGAIRQELAEFGYGLQTSLQVITSAKEKFLQTSSSNGNYYSVPFAAGSEKFDIRFCYNTYHQTIVEIANQVLGDSDSSQSILDVRLLNDVIECTTRILEGNIGLKVSSHRKCLVSSDPYSGESIHLFHIGGTNGPLTMGLEIPHETSLLCMNKMLGMERGDLAPDAENDLFGELINQIGGELIKKVYNYSGNYHRIFHGSYAASDQFDYLLKNPGLYFKQEYKIGKHPFFIIFGGNLKQISPFYHIWPVLQNESGFNDQIKLDVPKKEVLDKMIAEQSY